MRRFILPITAVSTLALFSSLSLHAADELSYTYVEADYLVQNVDLYEDDDEFDDVLEDIDDGDGFGINGSFAVSESFFIFGGYSQTEADFAFVDDTGAEIPSDQDVKTLKLGVGFNFEFARNTDFVARASYIDVDIGEFSLGQEDNDIDDGDSIGDAFDDLNEDTSDGYAIDAAVRSLVNEYIELGGGLRYTDLDAGDDVSVFGNVMWHFAPNFGVNLSADVGDNLTTYSIGLRASM